MTVANQGPLKQDNHKRNHRGNEKAKFWSLFRVVGPSTAAVLVIGLHKRRGPALADAAVSYHAGLAALKEVWAYTLDYMLLPIHGKNCGRKSLLSHDIV
jgi:hypothetical protein